MHRLPIIIIFCGLLLVIGSCKETGDLYDPVIIFSEPMSDDVIDLPDTMGVKVQITDDHIIRSVMLTLVNLNKIPVIAATWYYPGNRDFLLETSLPLVDKSLSSGPYQLLVTVSDGVNQKNKYRQIIIHEIPFQLLAYIVVTGQFSFKSTVIRLGPDFEPDTQFVFPEGYWQSAIHSMWEKFFFVSVEPSRLTAFNTESFEPEWEVDADPPRPLFTAIYPDKDLVFSTASGDAGILSSNGTVTLRTEPQPDRTIQCVSADELYIYASSVSLSGAIRELSVFYRVTGIIRDQKPISGEIRCLIPAAGNVLVFLQTPAGAKILQYAPDNLILTELNILQGETLQSATKISEDQYLLLTESGVISYDLALNRFSVFTDQPFHLCRYDMLSEVVFLIKDNTVFSLDRVSGDLMTEKSFPEEVLDFQILYNK